MRFPDFHLFRYLRNRPRGEKRFLILVPVTGLAGGLAAAALVRLLDLVQRGFWGGEELLARAQALPAVHRFLAPVIGGVLVGLLLLLARGPLRGHGTSGIIEAVTRGRGVLRVGAALHDIASILLTVGCGGSLGREGGLLRGGATLGSFLGRRFRLGGSQLNVLVACGAAAGMAAAYNAPIGGAMFAMEVVLGTFALESFGPVVVASAIGTIVSRALIRPYLVYSPPPVNPPVTLLALGHYVLLGIAVGVASVGFLLALRGGRWAFDRLPAPYWVTPVIGFAVVGSIGVWVPEIFGNGYDTVTLVLQERVPLSLILVLPGLKAAATVVTRGSGGSGGLFTPTLFLGAVLGSAYGSWAAHAFPGSTPGPGGYALIGMGAMLAGTTQAPLTAILMIFELTGDYPILLPLMISCTVAIVVCRLIGFESVYSQSLIEKGLRVGGRMEELVMSQVRVEDLMRNCPTPIDEAESLAEVVRRMREEGRKELYVTGKEGRFLGSVSLADIAENVARPDVLDRLRAGDVAYSDVPVLNPDDFLSDAIARWSRVGRDRLPVVDGQDTRRLVGELSAGDIFMLYSQEIFGREKRLAHFVRSVEDTRTETTFVELPSEYVVAQVTFPPSFEGASIRELSPRTRFGVNIIEVKRPIGGGQERRIIPDPSMHLRGGDGLIVVGRPADIERMSDPVRLASMLESARSGRDEAPAT
jgi:CIC family chloride channel protein